MGGYCCGQLGSSPQGTLCLTWGGEAGVFIYQSSPPLAEGCSWKHLLPHTSGLPLRQRDGSVGEAAKLWACSGSAH